LPTDLELRTLGIKREDASHICQSHGCNECNHSGFVGRSGIYEVVGVDDTMRSMIHDGASEQDMERHARSNSPGIYDDGMRLVLEGKTSLEEVLRVVREG